LMRQRFAAEIRYDGLLAALPEAAREASLIPRRVVKVL
jgi:hypothetical protein